MPGNYTIKVLDVLLLVGVDGIAIVGLSVAGLIGRAAWEVIQFVRECQ